MPIKTIIVPMLLVIASAGLPGCASVELEGEYYALAESDVPRELSKVSFPTYRVEPPDILLIESGPITRGEKEPLRRGEELVIQVENGVPLEIDPDVPPLQQDVEMPLQVAFRVINGPYTINPDGKVDFGPVYGKVPVAGMTVDEARLAIEDYLRRSEEQGGIGLVNPRVAVRLSAVQGKQPISGEHLVRPDGTVSLGVYGEIYVAGMTLDDVRYLIEDVLRNEGELDPQVSVDVLSYNSKVYYIIMEGGGFGEEVVRLPWTGNETVLDAIAQVQGLSQVSSKRIWIARPAPAGTNCAQILDVHWRAITAEGITTTNYQLAPGDRVYVAADKMIVIDNAIAKLLNPVERAFGFILLGSGMTQNIRFWSQQGQRGGGGF
ncbi:MAG: polysaccharide biosynthesis/export family protein [Planctomycetaceae bacterium]|nr:polysaccharide biosynthesis/export family protein [Planctomycetaceae bacterium]